MNNLKDLWNYRMMIGSLVKKELIARYKGSVLGFLWTFINPLFQLIIYTVLFSVIMRSGIDNYAMFLFVGLVPWLFCATSLTTGSMSVVMSAGLVQKIYFPRMVLPIVSVTANFVNMLLSFVIVFIALIATGVGIAPVAAMLPVVMIIEYFFVLGLVLIFSGLAVYFRDLEHILGIVTMAWMYLTPILYTVDMVPPALQTFMKYNPMTGVILSYRNVLYYQTMPEFDMLLLTVVYAAIFMVVGYFVFQRLQRKFAEEL
ncbi:MAG TPA: ABC transporter permease [Clostridiales bacterium]|nr:ABC transporter permease [Clostridiales bacterium]